LHESDIKSFMHYGHFFAMFQAIIIFQMAYILLQYYYVQKREYVYYFSYMACISLYAVLKYEPHLDVKVFTLFDTQAERHFDRALPLFAYFLYYRFARYFADIEVLIPRLNVFLKKMEWLVVVYVVFELLWEFAGLSNQLSEYIFWGVSAFLFCTTVYVGWWIFSKRNSLVNILILGAIVVNIGSFITVVLLHYQQLGCCKNIDALLPLNISIVIEMLLFTTGLAYKTKMAEREKFKAEQSLLLQTQKNLLMTERVGEMRSAIASNFHNDLSASLSGIGIYASLLQRAIKEKPEQVETLAGKISESAARLADSILDMVWALNPAVRLLSDVVAKLKSFEKDEMEPLNITLNIQCDEKLNAIHLNIKAVRSIYLMHKLFARFAVKFTGCNEVKSTVSANNDLLQLHISCQQQHQPDLKQMHLLNQLLNNAADGLQNKKIELLVSENKIWIELAFSIPNISD
jgi:signal transduction histidine kinase